MKVALSIGLMVLVLGAAYFMTEKSEAPQTKEFVLRVEEKKLQNESSLRVTEGDTVVLRVTADEAEEFHLHGYDRVLELEPDIEGVLTVVTTMSGRFIFELEKSKTELGALEVYPR